MVATIMVTPADLTRAGDIERTLIACCLWSDTHSTNGFDDAAALVRPDDFGTFAHQLVWRHMLALRDRRAPVTAASLLESISAAGEAAELGVSPGVWIGDTVTREPGDAHAEYYAHRVAEAARGRRLKRVAAEIVARTNDTSRPVADVAAECEQLLFDVTTSDAAGGPISAADLARETLERIDARAGGEVTGVPTGFAELDAIIGGLGAGEVVVIGARPSVGKTALATAIASNLSAGGVPTLMFSLEMSRGEITERLWSMRSGVPLHAIRNGRLSADWADKVYRAAGKFSKEPFQVDDGGDLTVSRLAATVRRAVRRNDVRVVVVDYLQLMTPEDAHVNNRVQQVGLISRRVKQLARVCNVSVVMLSQLNRACEDRPDCRPIISDLRECGDVEQDADKVLLLHRPRGLDLEAAVWPIGVIVGKHRNGPTGEVTLSFRRQNARFENATK
jgi:replicative DNA helicase